MRTFFISPRTSASPRLSVQKLPKKNSHQGDFVLGGKNFTPKLP